MIHLTASGKNSRCYHLEVAEIFCCSESSQLYNVVIGNMFRRSPAWQQEPPSPAPEFLMQPYMLKRAASSSPGQRFFSRAWRLDEEWDEGRSPAASPPVHTNTAPYSQELLFSCPRRQQRRQSWGPTVFSPSPLSTSPVHAVSRMHCVDLLSPCAPCQQRRQCLGATVISPSPEDARCVQVSCHYRSTRPAT